MLNVYFLQVRHWKGSRKKFSRLFWRYLCSLNLIFYEFWNFDLFSKPSVYSFFQQKFRAGGFNVIVATSIGEEGLDIMEVDLVICFDANVSPLRMIQRMGRTGRKNNGRVDILYLCWFMHFWLIFSLKILQCQFSIGKPLCHSLTSLY